MPIWNYNKLRNPKGTLDICLIKDEANVVVSHRGPRIEVPPLRENLANMVELAQGADFGTLDHSDPTMVSSSHVACKGPNTSRSMPHLRHWSL